MTLNKQNATATSLVSNHYLRIKSEDNKHLMDGLEFTSENSFAILQPYTGPTDWSIHPFAQRNKLNGKGQAIHFFQYDYTFNCMWNRLELTTRGLSRFDCVFTPDWSLYVDIPEQLNKFATYKTRFVGAYMQKCGFAVIPTFSWGNATSFKWCFEGLPTGGVMATCGTGIKHCSASFKLWCYGMRKVEEEKSPSLIYVYGEPVNVPGLQTELRFIPNRIINKKRYDEK